jgi:hypothetical protein
MGTEQEHLSQPASTSSRRRRNWQQETNDLLESIQRECNAVFERNKMISSFSHHPSNTSPRSTIVHVLDEDDGDDNESQQQQPSVVESSLSGGGSSAVSSSSSDDLNRALDDTEALVMSLLIG